MNKNGVLPATEELIERIGWLIRLRWVAVVGVALFLEVARRVFVVRLPLGSLYASLAALAIYNLVLTLVFRRFGERPSSGVVQSRGVLRWFLLPAPLESLGHDREALRAAVFANVQITVDLVLLAVILHFAGGIENPFLLFFVFHVIIASILLSRQATYAHATLGLVLISTVALGECWGALAHYPLGGAWRPDAYLDPVLVGAQLSVLGATLYLAAYMGSTIASHLRRREREVVLLSGDLQREAEKLAAAYEQVSRTERAKSQYMRKVAHELRGPLGTIQTALKVLLQGLVGELPDGARDLVARSERRAGELAELTHSLLVLSRAREAAVGGEAAEVELGEFVAGAVAEAQDEAERTGVSLTVARPPEPLLMRGDREGLLQLVGNLVGNALHYTPRGGRVTVSLARAGERARLQVEDSGIGIPAADLPRIFDEFFRASNARERRTDGTGLGLAIVNAVAVQHGGSVHVESEVGRGTRFTVELPLAGAGAQGPAR